jgi:hypothetical protein
LVFLVAFFLLGKEPNYKLEIKETEAGKWKTLHPFTETEERLAESRVIRKRSLTD